MAKAIFSVESLGNNGYTYAMREDGVVFVKSSFYSQGFGWTKTKWTQVTNPDDLATVFSFYEKAKSGDRVAIHGFASQVTLVLEGLRYRLPA